MDIPSLSKYAKGLGHDDLIAYCSKLHVGDIVLPDPFAVSAACWSDSLSSWPPLTFAHIFEYFVLKSGLYTLEQSKNITSLEGYNYFACQHVQPVLYHDPGVGDCCYLSAKVLPSQRQGQKTNMYECYLVVNKTDGTILTVHCTCMAGQGKACSHATAAAFKVEVAVRTGMSSTASTSELCQWNSMSRRKAEPCRVTDVVFSRPKYGQVRNEAAQSVRQATRAHLTADMIDLLRHASPNAVVFKALAVESSQAALRTDDQPTRPSLPIPTVDSILKSAEYTLADSKVDFMRESLSVSSDMIVDIEQLTHGQQSNPLWYAVRTGRLTASKFGMVLKACRRKSYPPSLFKSLLSQYDLSKVKSVQWGIDHEHNAADQYSATFGQLTEVGLFLHPSGALAATPDRIDEFGNLIEIKCPYEFRNSSIPEVLETDKFYVKVDSDGEFTLSKNHEYYDQCQGQLHLSGRSRLFLFVWLQSGCLRVEVLRDDQWCEENIPKLLEFYFNQFLPAYTANILCDS